MANVHGNIYYKQIRSGGVVVKTTNYTAVDADAWTTLVFNSSSAVTLTLPNPVTNSLWKIKAVNIGSGVLTISPNSLNLDGAAGSLTLGQFQGTEIATDGSNYFSERGITSGALTSPLTTKGDLWGWSTTNARVPVGADGQVLTADSTQTIGMRWAAAGGGSGALTQISQVVTSASQTSIHFASISGSYTDLILTYECRSQGAVSTDGLSMEVNTDTTSGDYDATQYLLASGGTISGGTVAGSATGAFVNNIPGTSTNANFSSSGRISIESYSKTTFYKRWHHEGAYAQSGNNTITIETSGVWKSTAVITDLLFTLSSSHAFVDGSVFTLYASS